MLQDTSRSLQKEKERDFSSCWLYLKSKTNVTSREYWISSFLIEQHQHIFPPRPRILACAFISLYAMLQLHSPASTRVPVQQAAGMDSPAGEQPP